MLHKRTQCSTRNKCNVIYVLAVQPPRPKSIQTDPPARIEMDNQVSQDVIYDFYEKHLAELQAEKDKAANTKQKSSDKDKASKRKLKLI